MYTNAFYLAPPTYDEQATAGATTIVEMDVYDKLVKQTEGLVHDLTTRFQQLDEDLSQNNPQVFAEYNNATPIMFTQMESRFHDLRKLAYVEAKQKWYNMYISAMETLADHFQKQQENQHKDQELLKQRTAYLVKNLPSVSEELNVIKKAVEEAKKKVKMYEQIDQGLLERWERDIKDQEAVITKSQKETEEAKEKEEKALEKLSLLAQKKAELKLAISQAEATKNAHSYVSELDVIRARDAFESCSGLCAWKLEKKTDDTIQYIIFDEVDVLLDTNKLKNHDVDAVFIRMLESRDLEYGPFAELVHGLQVTAKGIWSQEKILQDISIYWNRVRLIRDEINKVKRRFWIEIEPLTPDSVTDIELRGFRCNITIFSYMLKIKFLVSFEIRAEQVMAYPQSIDLSTLQVDFKYGDTTPEYLDTLVRIKFKENGIIGLLDTLCSIIDDFQ
ncbi:Spc7 kinetochore protein-domain-containing protein [Chlamydoabsidia padenii]|nr:Spc7 kinetochore protein-domain-containing protein [Chlamydoabsidia padenii]